MEEKEEMENQSVELPEEESPAEDPTAEEILPDDESPKAEEKADEENAGVADSEETEEEAEATEKPLVAQFEEEFPEAGNNGEPAEESLTNRNIERLMDVEMTVTVRFGKTEIPLREAVNFGIGSMIELNRSVDEPVELLVNNSPFARGEVVVIDGYYGVRVTEIGTPEERSQTLFSPGNNK
ncbi:MAG: flagellar motor switch protein FliN [Pyrinomonadaceae bacterium]